MGVCLLMLIVLRVVDLLTCRTCIHEPYNRISGAFGCLSKAGDTIFVIGGGGVFFFSRGGEFMEQHSPPLTRQSGTFLRLFGGNPDIVEGQHRHNKTYHSDTV